MRSRPFCFALAAVLLNACASSSYELETISVNGRDPRIEYYNDQAVTLLGEEAAIQAQVEGDIVTVNLSVVNPRSTSVTIDPMSSSVWSSQDSAGEVDLEAGVVFSGQEWVDYVESSQFGSKLLAALAAGFNAAGASMQSRQTASFSGTYTDYSGGYGSFSGTAYYTDPTAEAVAQQENQAMLAQVRSRHDAEITDARVGYLGKSTLQPSGGIAGHFKCEVDDNRYYHLHIPLVGRTYKLVMRRPDD